MEKFEEIRRAFLERMAVQEIRRTMKRIAYFSKFYKFLFSRGHNFIYVIPRQIIHTFQECA